MKRQDPVAVLGLLVALLVGAVQSYDLLKGSNLKLVAPDSVALVLNTPSKDEVLSPYIELVFFNDTTSDDSEAIKTITATLKLGRKKITPDY